MRISAVIKLKISVQDAEKRRLRLEAYLQQLEPNPISRSTPYYHKFLNLPKVSPLMQTVTVLWVNHHLGLVGVKTKKWREI